MSDTTLVTPVAILEPKDPFKIKLIEGEPIENISFRNEEVGTLVITSMNSEHFPIHQIFPDVDVQPHDDRYVVQNLVFSLENDYLVLRWSQNLPTINTLRLYAVSNKRTEKIEAWVSFQNSYRTPFKLLVGERLDLFFKAYDLDNNPVYLNANARTLFFAQESLERDLNSFWQVYTPSVPGFEVSQGFQEIPDNVALEAQLQDGSFFIVWNSIFFPNFSIARYRLDYSLNDGPVQTIILEEPDSVSYVFGKISQTYPYKVQIQLSLEYREYSTNDFFWVRPQNSFIEVHQEKEIVDIFNSISYHLPTPKDVGRLLHDSLNDGSYEAGGLKLDVVYFGPSKTVFPGDTIVVHLAKYVRVDGDFTKYDFNKPIFLNIQVPDGYSIDEDQHALYLDGELKDTTDEPEDFLVRKIPVIITKPKSELIYGLGAEIRISQNQAMYGVAVEKQTTYAFEYLTTLGAIRGLADTIASALNLDDDMEYVSTLSEGADSEDLEQVRVLAPLFYMTSRRAVTPRIMKWS